MNTSAKKVLIVANNDLGIGGIQSVIMSIIRSLTDDFQFDVVVFDHSHTDYEQEVLRQGNIFTIQNHLAGSGFRKKIDYYIRFFNNYRQLKAIIKGNGPYAAIHCHNFYESALALLAAKQEGIERRIVHSHSVLYVDKKKYVRRLYQSIYRRIILNTATDLVACSKGAGEYLYGKRNDIKVIPNGIDVDRFLGTPSTCNNQWNFIQVGRWGKLKNQIFTINVFSEIYKEYPKAHLTFIGDGDNSYYLKMKETIKQNNISDAVSFLPANTDVPTAMAANNALIFPSVFEGLGIVAIEAQALGMQCFASTGVPFEVDLGNVTFIDLSDGPHRWADAIIELIKKLGISRHYVDMSRYDMNNVKEIYRMLYGGNYSVSKNWSDYISQSK